MAEQPGSGRAPSRPSEEDVRRFVSKLENFATGLSPVEREMLRAALGVGRPPADGDVKGYLAGLTDRIGG